MNGQPRDDRDSPVPTQDAPVVLVEGSPPLVVQRSRPSGTPDLDLDVDLDSDLDSDLDPDLDTDLDAGPDAGPGTEPDDGSGPLTPPLVAIGASAGGLEALEGFFEACDPDSGTAYVVVQHLSPDHRSLMAELLGRRTSMRVVVADNGMPLEPDRVHLIPPAHLMTLDGGRLRLRPRDPIAPAQPIDTFFCSMAEQGCDPMVAVVLSGTGSDGTHGAGRVRAAGGLVLAQTPDTAKFDGMPRSVIGAGTVHDVLPVERIAGVALAHLRTPGPRAARAFRRPEPAPSEDPLEDVLRLLHEGADIDFRDYKPATVLRRLERRMQIRAVDGVGSYLDLVRDDPAELDALREELLIGVTRFFRDREAFEALLQRVVVPLVSGADDGDTIRVWHAGVSTGEEAYSVAMLFLEEISRQQRWCQLKIFGTDVDEAALEVGRRGLFNDAAVAELDQGRLERFFERQGQYWGARRFLRQHLMFARHNLLSDAPFTRMDLVVCRNTLIYFKPHAQDRALARLQFALHADGMLVLGPSESLGASRDAFAVVDSRHKIFRRLPGAARGMGDLEVLPGPAPRRTGPVRGHPARVSLDGGLVEAATDALLSTHAPPSLLVSEHGEVLHLFGDVAALLRLRTGAATLELTRLLPEGLAAAALALVTRSLRERMTLRTDVGLLDVEGDSHRRMHLVARPLPLAGSLSHVLLSVVDADADHAGRPAVPDVEAVSADRIDAVAMLEQELSSTRESLQVTIEELETSNEELQATNEELISANEELQSSNEELQSLNEELNTVNAEYLEKGELLQRTGADLETMARAAGVAMVFVDSDLHLTRYSPEALTLFNLRAGDLGRPLGDLTHRLDYPQLLDDLSATVVSGEATVRQVQALDVDRAYLVRLVPYVLPDTGRPGAVISAIDITSTVAAGRLQAVIDALPEHIAVLTADATIALVNGAWRRFADDNGGAGNADPGSNYLSACLPVVPTRSGGTRADQDAVQAVRGVRDVLSGRCARFTLRYPCHSPTRRRWFVMNVAPLGAAGSPYRAVVSHLDISDWYDAPEEEDGV